MSERRSELKAVTSAEQAAKLSGREVTQFAAQWVDNWNQINGRLVSLAQASLRNSINAAEQLRQCQSPTELMDIQIKLARQAYDEYLGEARSISELVVKLSSEAISSVSVAQPR
ncbi:MAG TPA: phasin family protein [Magnetospirillum sp.]|nr:phasin family protein [Magnetospirillum sp.]